jgi:hypothetical protein
MSHPPIPDEDNIECSGFYAKDYNKAPGKAYRHMLEGEVYFVIGDNQEWHAYNINDPKLQKSIKSIVGRYAAAYFFKRAYEHVDMGYTNQDIRTAMDWLAWGRS